MILRAAELADGKSLAQELMYNIMEVKKNKAACVNILLYKVNGIIQL
ncbi:hypothetical protein B4099_1549 [Heyndrickxia coagulans]|jgi:hypothetical protein|uniref:Uncharacterized protein n=1 Tax=Heyndrickxia coagulans TaxID=1398 RepID=A0A150K6M0_HEYCO|nr:hypothetical protein B4099_1549 [Heyndrickxia coagulans]